MSTIGHNLPPGPPSPETVNELLTAELSEEIARQKEILAGIERFKRAHAQIEDDDTSGKAADFAGGKGLIQQWLNKMEARRKQEKMPYDAAAAAAHAVFRTLMVPIEEGQTAIRKINASYLRQKEIREKDAALKEAAEAAARAKQLEQQALQSMNTTDLGAAAAVAEEAERLQEQASKRVDTKVRGAMGAVSSLRRHWAFKREKSDLLTLVKAIAAGKAPLDYVTFNDTRIGFAVRSEKVREIPGCVIEEDYNAV